MRPRKEDTIWSVAAKRDAADLWPSWTAVSSVESHTGTSALFSRRRPSPSFVALLAPGALLRPRIVIRHWIEEEYHGKGGICHSGVCGVSVRPCGDGAPCQHNGKVGEGWCTSGGSCSRVARAPRAPRINLPKSKSHVQPPSAIALHGALQHASWPWRQLATPRDAARPRETSKSDTARHRETSQTLSQPLCGRHVKLETCVKHPTQKADMNWPSEQVGPVLPAILCVCAQKFCHGAGFYESVQHETPRPVKLSCVFWTADTAISR